MATAAADLLALALIQQNTRIPRNFRPERCKSFDIPEVDFVSSYRLNKSLALQLIEELRPYLQPRTSNRKAFSVEIKVLCALRFYATGSDQRSVADDFKLSMAQQSVSKNLRLVTEALNKLLPKYVKFPLERSIQIMLKREFNDYCGMPGVVGAIDCTHVALIAPKNDGHHFERNYVNRKNFHSINVQLVCDMKQKILNVVARFPGSCHDAYIWRSCNLRAHVETGTLIHGDGWLLGDSGYPREPWLKTPRARPVTQADHDFNFSHARGRCVIERLNGTLKSRFRCLKRERTLHYSPKLACKIINACCILHNICVEHQLAWVHAPLDDDDLPFDTGNGTDYE